MILNKNLEMKSNTMKHSHLSLSTNILHGTSHYWDENRDILYIPKLTLVDIR